MTISDQTDAAIPAPMPVNAPPAAARAGMSALARVGLVLALILSLGLSILFAWGWYHSDPVPDPLAQHAAGPLIPNR